jgi:hypothetical protein
MMNRNVFGAALSHEAEHGARALAIAGARAVSRPYACWRLYRSVAMLGIVRRANAPRAAQSTQEESDGN